MMSRSVAMSDLILRRKIKTLSNLTTNLNITAVNTPAEHDGFTVPRIFVRAAQCGPPTSRE